MCPGRKSIRPTANLLLCTLMIPPVAILLGARARDEALSPHAFAGFADLAMGLLVLDGRVLRLLGHRPRVSSGPGADSAG
jgi:hypothetical protein